MNAPVAKSSSGVRKALDGACARNTPAKLVYSGTTGNVHTANVRLIKLNKNEIYTDAPGFLDARAKLRKHQPVEVYTLIDGNRCSFRSRVERVFTTVELNSHRRISAITLAIPQVIAPRQRRQCYRVSLAGREDIEVRLCPTTRGRADCCPLDAKPFGGRMLNLSAGGALVIVPAKQRTRFYCDEGLFVEFSLPDVEQPFYLSAEVRHFRKVHDDTDTLVGLRFRTDGNLMPTPVRRRATRFIALEQRRQLRRGRR